MWGLNAYLKVGSSPRVRGTCLPPRRLEGGKGLIPAGAGNILHLIHPIKR